MEYDQLILECYERSKGPSSGWVHVSYNSEANRKESLTYDRVNGYRRGLIYT